MNFTTFTPRDLFAAFFFIALWVGYTFFADWWATRRPSLFSAMRAYRLQWMRAMLTRDNRLLDAAILQNLLAGTNFFASTSILILGGLIALLASAGKAVDVMASLPYTQAQSESLVEYKILLEIGIFVYAFFKFTWSMRQFNFLATMVGAVPDLGDQVATEALVNRAANVAQLAGEDNNRGLRAYYFGLAALTWFFHPWALILTSILVVGILYHREFMSRTLQALTD